MKLYKTRNLDEAVYLRLKDIHPKSIKYIETSTCEFTFEHTQELERNRKMFYTGSPQISLHKWLAVRFEMKMSIKGSRFVESKPTKISSKTIFRPIDGQVYWCIVSGQPVQSKFDKKDQNHINRINQGNCFRLKAHCEHAIELNLLG